MANPLDEPRDLLLLLPPEVINNQLLMFLANDAQSVTRLGQVSKYWHAKCLESSEESYLLWQKLHWYRWNAPKLKPKIVFQAQQSHADFLPFDGAFEDLKHKYCNAHDKDECDFELFCMLCDECTEARSNNNGQSGQNIANAKSLWRRLVAAVERHNDVSGQQYTSALLWAIIRCNESFGFFFRAKRQKIDMDLAPSQLFLPDCVGHSTASQRIVSERQSAEKTLQRLSCDDAHHFSAWIALYLLYASYLDVAGKLAHHLFVRCRGREELGLTANEQPDFFTCLGYLARFRHGPLEVLLGSYLNDESIMVDTINEIVGVIRHRVDNDPKHGDKFSLLVCALEVFHQRFGPSNDTFDANKVVAELPVLRWDDVGMVTLMLAATLRLVLQEFDEELDVMVLSASESKWTDSPFLVGSFFEDWFIDLKEQPGAPWRRLNTAAWQRMFAATFAPPVRAQSITKLTMLAQIAQCHLVQLAIMGKVWCYKECRNFLSRLFDSSCGDAHPSSTFTSVVLGNDWPPFPEVLITPHATFGNLIPVYRQRVADEISKRAQGR